MSTTIFSSITYSLQDRLGAVRRRRRRKLAEILINGESRKGEILPPPLRGLITTSRQLARDLLSDTRQRYQASLDASSESLLLQADADRDVKRRWLVAVSGLVLATAGALISPLFMIPAAASILYAARHFFFGAFQGIVYERRFDYRSMYALGIAVPLFTGFVWPAAFGAVWAVTSLYLVSRTERQSKRTLSDLFGGQIHSVWLVVDGEEIEVPIEQVEVGDLVAVQAGQLIPVDGVIVQGVASIDQHALTGESQPVEKGVDDPVMASTVVLSGRLRVRVEKTGNATVAAQIGNILSQTDDFLGTLQTRSDQLANQMVLPVLGLSIIALPLTGISGAAAVLWYYPGARMMFFGPLSMLSFLQLAAQHGILVKDGRSLEVLEKVDIVVFDKTGTLTLEQPTVRQIYCYNGLSDRAILRYAAAAETRQSHPIAQAIQQAARRENLEIPVLEQVHYQVGYGLRVQIADCAVRVGSIRFMQMEGIPLSQSVIDQQAQSHEEGHSLVFVAVDDELAGAIELEPTIRAEAKAVVDALHARGLETVIISGDHEEPTRRLASELGIDRYYAEVLPEEKSGWVAQMQAEGRKVCFVGDGINDAIALKTADVSVSLRGATTIATDAAQIVFMDGSLAGVPTLFDLADRFAANMRVNLAASMGPNFLGIAGTLLFGWGFTLCVFLSQAGTPIAFYNSLKPLLNGKSPDMHSHNPSSPPQ